MLYWLRFICYLFLACSQFRQFSRTNVKCLNSSRSLVYIDFKFITLSAEPQIQSEKKDYKTKPCNKMQAHTCKQNLCTRLKCWKNLVLAEAGEHLGSLSHQITVAENNVANSLGKTWLTYLTHVGVRYRMWEMEGRGRFGSDSPERENL